MNFFDSLMAPLGKDYCALFYYLGLLSLFLALFAVIFTSCISTKDITYLQPSAAAKSDSIKVSQENSKLQ